MITITIIYFIRRQFLLYRKRRPAGQPVPVIG
jgi:hypothetical protein